jgi:hypothetical protein
MQKLQSIRKENTAFRLSVSAINLLVLGLLTFHHYFTGTEGLKTAMRVLEEATNREASSLLKSLYLADRCDPEENPLILYLWPGTIEGCICHKDLGTSTRNPQDFDFLDRTCGPRARNCIAKQTVRSQSEMLLYKHTTGQMFCGA